MPKIFYHVQSSYRLLMFVALGGAILSGVALAAWTRGRMRRPHLLVALALVGIASMSYLPRHAPLSKSELTRVKKYPDLGNNGGRTNYLPSPAAAARTSWVHPDMNFVDAEHGLVESHHTLSTQPDGSPAQAYVPRAAIRAGGSLLIEGTVPREYGEPPAKLNITLDNVALPEAELKIAEGFRVTIPLPAELPGDGVVRMTLHADRYPIDGRYAFPIHRLSFVPAAPPARAFMPDGASKPVLRTKGRSRFVVELAGPTLLQLPVLYYPGVLRVKVGRKDVEAGNIGTYVALPMEAGRHRITVWYAGVGWANVVSAAGWAIAGAGLVMGVVRRLKRRRASRVTHAPRRRRAAFSTTFAFLCIVVMSGTLFAPTGWREASKYYKSGPKITVTASHSVGETYAPINAFDDNIATEWAVPTGQADAVLSIVPAHPAKLRKAVLEARPTGLHEGWMHVRVEQYLGDKQLAAQEFSLPEAAIKPAVEINLTPVVADRIEFHFSSPVNVLKDGHSPVDIRTTSPGYREILLTWEK